MYSDMQPAIRVVHRSDLAMQKALLSFPRGEYVLRDYWEITGRLLGEITECAAIDTYLLAVAEGAEEGRNRLIQGPAVIAKQKRRHKYRDREET